MYSDGQGMVAIIAVWLIIHSAVENGSAYGRSSAFVMRTRLQYAALSLANI